MVAAVEAVRDLAVARPVLRKVRVEKEERYAATRTQADEEMDVPLADAHATIGATPAGVAATASGRSSDRRPDTASFWRASAVSVWRKKPSL